MEQPHSTPIRHSHRGLRVEDVYFDDPIDFSATDLVRYAYRSQPLTSDHWRHSATLWIDLRLSEADLLRQADDNTRYEIRRARDRDAVQVTIFDRPTDAELQAFADTFADFVAEKQIDPLDVEALTRLQARGMLTISTARSSSGELLATHCYLRHQPQSRLRLLHSVSLFRGQAEPGQRALVGRANRFLHFADMLAAKEQGMLIYDLGGYYLGDSDSALLAINRFKESFGGRPALAFSGEHGASVRGRLFLAARTWKDRLLRSEALRARTPRRAEAEAAWTRLNSEGGPP